MSRKPYAPPCVAEAPILQVLAAYLDIAERLTADRTECQITLFSYVTLIQQITDSAAWLVQQIEKQKEKSCQ